MSPGEVVEPSQNFKPELFDFLSYREYLKVYYDWRKSNQKWFSYRYVAKEIGIDHAVLIKVLKKERHLTEKHVDAVEKLCGFSVEESEFFRYIFVFEKSKNQDQIKVILEKILGYKERKIYSIELDKFEFYTKWYYSAIRSLIDFFPFNGSYKELSQKLSPSISASEAREAVELLLKLNLIFKDDKGFLRITSQSISANAKWGDIAIRKFQADTMRLANEAIDRYEKKDRDISTMTLSLNKERFAELQELTAEYRKRITQLVTQHQDEDTVYQCNIQLFPLSQ